MADFTSMRASCTNAGTITTPPPIPSRPERSPDTAPMAAYLPASERPGPGTPASELPGASGASVSARGSSAGTAGTVRPMRYDDSPSNPAVISCRRWPSPGTCSEATLPTTAPRRPSGTVATTAGQRTSCSRT